MYRNILVPLDGSRLAESVLPWVSRIARSHGAKLTLLGVVQPFDAESRQPSIRSLATSGERRDARLMRYLKGVAMFLKLRGVEAEPAMVSGLVPEQILAEAGERGCDLIALFVHENAALGRGILGAMPDAALGQADPSLMLVFSDGTRDCWEANSVVVLGAKISAPPGIWKTGIGNAATH